MFLVLSLKKGVTTFYRMIACSASVCTFTDRYKLFSTAIYYFRWPYPNFDTYILLSATIYYVRRYIILLVLPDRDFIKIQEIPPICGLRDRIQYQ